MADTAAAVTDTDVEAAVVVPCYGPFDEYVYELILKAALDGWSSEKYIRRNSRRNLLAPKEIEVPIFLAQCCTINREWCMIAQKLLYGALVTNDCSESYSCLTRTLRTPSIAAHVRYLCLKPEENNAANHLTDIGSFPNLRCLVVQQEADISARESSFTPLAGEQLRHLLYEGGDTHSLAQLLAMLPHLQTLHVGRFLSGSRRRMFLPDGSVICRLRQVTFQSIYHYDEEFFEWMFSSSEDSMEHLTIARYSGLLKDLIPYFGKAKRLDLTVNRVVPEKPKDYQLSAILPQFTRLVELHLHVGQDWGPDWPDAKHASLKEEFPHVRVYYEPYKHNFLECIV